jgi:hypothetical protein
VGQVVLGEELGRRKKEEGNALSLLLYFFPYGVIHGKEYKCIFSPFNENLNNP